jgi:UDP-glucose 4-epimerase
VRIMVIGGAGYIGGTVSGFLAQRGHRTVIYDNLSHGRLDLLPQGVEFIRGELADRAALEAIFREARERGEPFDGVMHFAALIEAGESMRHPGLYFRNNTAATLSLLEAMIAEGPLRLVFSSTAAVYGEPEKVPIEEDAKLAPTNAYGESKLLVERMLAWFGRIHGLSYASLRYFNVAGAAEGPDGVIARGEAHSPETHLIPLVLDVALGRSPSIRVFGDDYPTPDGTCIRDYIHVADLAEAHLLTLEKLVGSGGKRGRSIDDQGNIIVNLGNHKGYSVKEVIASVQRVTGRTIPVDMQPRRPGDPAVLIASSRKAIEELGWTPRYTELDDIVRTAWVWHQKRYAP